MTAQITDSAAPFKDSQFDGDYCGMSPRRFGQFWDRIAEGNMIWGRTSPHVHARAALMIMTRQGQRDGLPR